jgi:SAM-dependent methyltransferase
MESEKIKRHWLTWASKYGTSLRATTKTQTAKALELDALSRRLRSILPPDSPAYVLEVGCGNGVNCIELAKQFPHIRLDGVDYIPEMIAAAEANTRTDVLQDRLRFWVGDALNVANIAGLKPRYDIVFTDRCLINLNSVELQKEGIRALASKVRAGGYLLMIENSMTSYREQNRCRRLLNLPERVPPDFNLFFDEDEIRPYLAALDLRLTDIEDFSSLHDLILYALIPATNGGHVDYDHSLVQAAAELSKKLSASNPSIFGSFGQNRFFVCKKGESRS